MIPVAKGVTALPWWPVLECSNEDCVKIKKKIYRGLASGHSFRQGLTLQIYNSGQKAIFQYPSWFYVQQKKKSFSEIFPLCPLTLMLSECVLDIQETFHKCPICVPAQIQSPAPAWILTAPGLLLQTSSFLPLCLIPPCFTPPSPSSCLSPKGCTHLACLYCVINLTLHLGLIF